VLLAGRPWLWRAIGELTFTVIACSCAGGLFAWGSTCGSRHAQRRTGGLLRSAHLEEDEIVVMADHWPAAAPLRTPPATAKGRGGASPVEQPTPRTLAPADLIQQTRGRRPRGQIERCWCSMRQSTSSRPSSRLKPLELTRLTDGLTIRRIHHVPIAVVIGEEYWVYLIEQTLSQKSEVKSRK
jgi:hypothetical protein